MHRIIYTESYEEKARKFLKKHPEMKGQYEKCLTLLELNPYHPSLRLHQFKTSRFEGYAVSNLKCTKLLGVSLSRSLEVQDFSRSIIEHSDRLG